MYFNLKLGAFLLFDRLRSSLIVFDFTEGQTRREIVDCVQIALYGLDIRHGRHLITSKLNNTDSWDATLNYKPLKGRK